MSSVSATYTIDDTVAGACLAVARSASPRTLNAIHQRVIRWPTSDLAADVETLLTDAMREGWHQDRTVPFWEASGRALAASLCEVVAGLDELDATYLVGAAVHARVMAGLDLVPDAVLRQAERAACWAAGRSGVEG